MLVFSIYGVDKMTIKQGDRIKVEYTGTFDDGTVFDTSKGKGPLEFEVGSGQIIPGFDKAVVGMKKGGEKKIKIDPKDAYGDYNSQLVKEIPRRVLPPEQEPKPGMMLALGTPDGQRIPARITGVTDEHVTIDLNHPLAGKKLNFNVKIVDICS